MFPSPSLLCYSRPESPRTLAIFITLFFGCVNYALLKAEVEHTILIWICVRSNSLVRAEEFLRAQMLSSLRKGIAVRIDPLPYTQEIFTDLHLQT